MFGPVVIAKLVITVQSCKQNIALYYKKSLKIPKG